jgi:hypothetical protein
MAFIVTGSETKHYTPAPEGTQQAVAVDIIDLGMLPNPFKDGALQRKVEIVWQLSETRDDGKRHQVRKRYTASLNEKATLRHDLESWRGRPFTMDELAGFDLESIKGANCLLNVVHKAGTKDPSKVFANVAAVMPLIKGLPKIEPDGYVRFVPEASASDDMPIHSEFPPVEEELTDESIPF